MRIYPGPTAENLAAIPAVLQARKQWVLWRGYARPTQPDKLNKIPYIPYHPDEKASTTDALTWSSYADAVSAWDTVKEEWEQDTSTPYLGSGIGYVTTQQDGYVGVDLDHCVDATTGVIQAWAQEYLTRLKSYSEITPSGTGLRIWVLADLPPGHNRKGDVEMYSTGRFFTVTGWHLEETPPTIEARQKPLQGLWAKLFGPQVGDKVNRVDSKGEIKSPDPETIVRIEDHTDGEPYAYFAEASGFTGYWSLLQCESAPPLQGNIPPLPTKPDIDIITLARTANSGKKFVALWEGKWADITNAQGRAYPSQSEADLALCGLLCEHTRDPTQIDRIFRMTQLMRPKWDRIRYAQQTIQTAIAGHTYKATLVVHASQTRPQASHARVVRLVATQYDRPSVPLLPAEVYCETPRVSTFLQHYIAHSLKWAPRAAPDYHAAVGVWVLSTIAARRLVMQMGSSDIFPTLFLALVSESTLWTKTTAAALGVRLVRRAGCGYLLGPDRTTPQFLLKLMAGIVPADYGSKHTDQQEAIDKAYGFCAKRGWFYEEWGGMLHQMRRHDSPQAELNKLLIVLEGGAQTFETGTIQRGLERIEEPYLALLANATPHDLYPFMQEDDAWWRDGFWPRFACVTPPLGGVPSNAQLPHEAYRDPTPLIVQLMDWHAKLGHPLVSIEEERESSGKRTGKWHGTISNFPQHVMELDAPAYDAYIAYNEAMFALIRDQSIPPLVSADLRPWYSRAHEKALRVAMLLASVDGHEAITLPYWQEAQAMVETWRTCLHSLVHDAANHGDVNAKSRRLTRIESRVTAMLSLDGPMPARQIQRRLYGVPSEELNSVLKNMLQIGTITSMADGQKTLFLIFDEQ